MPYQDENTCSIFKITVNTFSIDNIFKSFNYIRKNSKDPYNEEHIKPDNEEHIRFYTLLEEELEYRGNDTDEFDICEEVGYILDEVLEDKPDLINYKEDLEIRNLFNKFYVKKE